MVAQQSSQASGQQQLSACDLAGLEGRLCLFALLTRGAFIVEDERGSRATIWIGHCRDEVLERRMSSADIQRIRDELPHYARKLEIRAEAAPRSESHARA